VSIDQIIADLSRPEAYPEPPDAVEVRQTHISAVFLAGQYAYKVKKPLDLGFLDFRTLAQRRHFCAEEVRLNRRLAPDVYLDVVPITLAGDHYQVGGAGAAVEYAVWMRRLPDDHSLAAELARGGLDAGTLADVGRRLAAFHAAAAGGPEVAQGAGFDTVAFNARENFEQLAPYVGRTLTPEVYERLRVLTEAALERLRPVIADRVARGVPRDTHGDLRLDHVYRFPEVAPPHDLVVIDCIEFNERFRFADPVSDLAFLAMDLLFRGRADLAAALTEAWFTASGDAEGRALLPLYLAYRAVVRAKVGSMALDEAELPAAQRAAELARARAHGLLALGALAPPAERPGLVLVAGLPGTGKSRLAGLLAAAAGFIVVATDVTRKGLAGVRWGPEVPPDPHADLYTAEWNERTYDACLAEAERHLLAGRRVLVDGTFREARRRAAFLALARRLAVPARVLVCTAPPEVVRARLDARRGDPSDATWAVYERLAGHWEPPGPGEPVDLVAAVGADEAVLGRALAVLRAAGLDEPPRPTA
jgi:uncharacterized protein